MFCQSLNICGSIMLHQSYAAKCCKGNMCLWLSFFLCSCNQLRLILQVNKTSVGDTPVLKYVGVYWSIWIQTHTTEIITPYFTIWHHMTHQIPSFVPKMPSDVSICQWLNGLPLLGLPAPSRAIKMTGKAQGIYTFFLDFFWPVVLYKMAISFEVIPFPFNFFWNSFQGFFGMSLVLPARPSEATATEALLLEEAAAARAPSGQEVAAAAAPPAQEATATGALSAQEAAATGAPLVQEATAAGALPVQEATAGKAPLLQPDCRLVGKDLELEEALSSSEGTTSGEDSLSASQVEFSSDARSRRRHPVAALCKICPAWTAPSTIKRIPQIQRLSPSDSLLSSSFEAWAWLSKVAPTSTESDAAAAPGCKPEPLVEEVVSTGQHMPKSCKNFSKDCPRSSFVIPSAWVPWVTLIRTDTTVSGLGSPWQQIPSFVPKMSSDVLICHWLNGTVIEHINVGGPTMTPPTMTNLYSIGECALSSTLHTNFAPEASSDSGKTCKPTKHLAGISMSLMYIILYYIISYHIISYYIISYYIIIYHNIS